MVVITIVTQKNGETIFFDEPIPQVHFMKLISCSLYNSWDTLKESTATLSDKNGSVEKVFRLSSGYYNLESLKKELNDLFKPSYDKFEAQINTPLEMLQIKNKGEKIISFKGGLEEFVNNRTGFWSDVSSKRPNYTNTYFIHCDLINRNLNFFNNKKTDLLAKIDVKEKGKPYEKVRYDASPQQPIRDCSTSSHVNSITISVRDQYGELFDFKGMPLEFELELN